MESLKKDIFKKLRGNHITLASTLEKAERWDKKADTLVLSYKNSFEAALVEKEKSKVLNIIKDFDPSINKIEINRDLNKKIVENESIKDEQIEKILSMFRGSIV